VLTKQIPHTPLVSTFAKGAKEEIMPLSRLNYFQKIASLNQQFLIYGALLQLKQIVHELRKQ
jgi:hypothetical protein